IKEDSARMFALVGVADAKNRSGEKEKAIEFLTEAAHLTETISQFSVRSTALNELAKHFLNYGESAKAREIAHENLVIISQIRDDSLKSTSLANLAEVYEQGNFDLTDAEKEMLYTMIRRAEW
ncbi:MAG TPA: hypothetical protein VGD05_05380, partial [Pyrinomonadaceae bacterium]